MKLRFAFITACVLAQAGLAVTRAAPVQKPLPGLRLQLSATKAQYALGEPIEVTMRYTYTGALPLMAEVVTYDRSGRIGAFDFEARDERGRAARDPFVWSRQIIIGGGARSDTKLTTEQPYEQRVYLNEWIAFDRPGRYTIKAHSSIVHLDNGSTLGGDSIPLESEPLQITIIAPNDQHRLERIAHARAALQSRDLPPAERNRHQIGDPTKTYRWRREQAIFDLRCMMDKRAIPVLIAALGNDSRNVALQAMLGLYSFRDMTPAKAALLKAASNSARPLMPQQMALYIGLLIESDLRARYPGSRKDRLKGLDEIMQRWQTFFERKITARLPHLTTRQAAQTIVEAMSFNLLPVPQTRHWKLVIDHAATLTGFTPSRAAAMIEYNCRDKAVIPNLKKMIANPSVAPTVRMAGKAALRAMGQKNI